MNKFDEALAKIARPRNRHIYRRTSLFGKLDEAAVMPGIWICGPPGSGKTTLISSYLEEKNRTCLWYQIDDGDSDVATFFWYMRLAAKKFSARSYSELQPYSSAYQGSLEAFAARFFEKLYASLPPNFLIVLDDYHLNRDGAELDAVVVQAISTLPRHGNISVLSREQPPPRFSRLLANEMLGQIGWDDLRLRNEEIHGISELRQPGHSVGCFENIASRIDGWAAGLIFQLQDSQMHRCGNLPANANGHEALFGYFANEVLEQQKPEYRNMVMQLALLPVMTLEMARRLTETERAVRLLKWLHRNNNFVELQALEVPTYRFHPLFREFLLDQLKLSSSEAELHKLQNKAAELLEGAGFRSAARELYGSSGEWGKVVELICVDAPTKFRQGRIRSLEKSIGELPEAVIAEYPWLSYWLGATRMFFDPRGAHQFFSAAFELFQEADDVAGSLAAWSGAVNSLLGEWGDMRMLDQWIGRGEILFPEDGPFPKGPMAPHAITAMCSALSICRPHSANLDKYVRKTHELITTSSDRTFSLMGCNLLLIFYAWMGELSKMRMLVEAIRPDMESENASDAHRVMWAAAEAWFDLVSGNPEKSIASSVSALELGEKCGVHMFDYKFHGMATQANLILGNIEEARSHIDLYLHVIPSQASLLHFHANFLSAWQAWQAGSISGAREKLSIASSFLTSAGSAPIISTKTDIAAAILHLESGEISEGKARLANAERVANATGSAWLQYHCLLLAANVELKLGNKKKCLLHLSSGLELGRTHGLVVTDWWDAPSMSRLCEVALANNIEPQHVHRIIDETGLRPGSIDTAPEAWPWPVKVKVLGQFRLKVNGEIVSQRIGSQKKVLELVKALVAHGGDRVAAARLADAVWPDAEGDNARNALKTTVHRLRKLLGIPEAVELRDGFLSLSKEHCWVDAFVFNALSRTPRSDASRISKLKKALVLYKGQLLDGETTAPWMIAPREQLQKRAHRIVMELGGEHEGRRKWGKAIRVYRKGLELDNLDEQVWRHLMQCYRQSGRNEDALASYEQCCSELKVHLARKPSAKTKMLAESISQSL